MIIIIIIIMIIIMIIMIIMIINDNNDSNRTVFIYLGRVEYGYKCFALSRFGG